MRLFYVILVVLLCMTCSKEDVRHTHLSSPKLQWQLRIDDDILFSSFRPIIYKNTVIYSKYFFDVRGSSIIALDKITGEKLWEWDEFTQWNISKWKQVYIYNSFLIFTFTGTTYAVNLDSGETKWKIETGEKGIKSITGLGNKVYQVSSLANGEKYFVNEIDIDNGTWRNLLEIEGRDTLVPFVKLPVARVDSRNDTILYLSRSLYNYSNYESENHLVAYNITHDSFEYDIIHEYEDVFQGGLGGPIYHEEKIYIPVDGYLFCYQANNGELIWKKFIEGGTGFTGFIIEAGKLFVGSEGFNPSLYALNPDTGAQLWKIASSGTSSLMAYLNGVIYFVGGGDGLLHAVDAANGEHLWQEKSPDVEENSDAFFNNLVTVDPETGRIYTASWISVLCYEAAR